MTITRRALLAGVAAAPLVAAVPTAAFAQQSLFWTNSGVFGEGYVARGYDVVAYFTQGEPVEGSEEYEVRWPEGVNDDGEPIGALWRFASQEHMDLFLADPEAYAPQYGGYCAWAVSQGYTASVDPAAWDIVDGRLYLNYSLGVQARWHTDVEGHIASADINWPGVLN